MSSKPPNVDPADWAQLQSALSSVSSPSFGVPTNQLNHVTADTLGNDPKLEERWAEQAAKHAMTYERLLAAFADKSKLRLTAIDADIYQSFRATFPSLAVDRITEKDLKNESSKLQWREWCMQYKDDKNINDYHFGTLLRLDADRGYGMEEGGDNATIVPRIQFLAIEIARNREGKNNRIQR